MNRDELERFVRAQIDAPVSEDELAEVLLRIEMQRENAAQVRAIAVEQEEPLFPPILGRA